MITSSHTPIARRVARAASVSVAFTVLLSTLVLAGSANAGTPEGWSDPEGVDRLHAVALLVGGPLLLFVLITLAVYLPSLAKGAKDQLVAAGTPGTEWFGGPSKRNDELAAPDTEESKAGGASGRW